jgi:hypothetical protein
MLSESGDFTAFWQQSNKEHQNWASWVTIMWEAVIQLHQQIQAKNKALIRNQVEHKSQI